MEAAMKSLSLLVVSLWLLLGATDPSIVVIGAVSDTQCAFTVPSSAGRHASMLKTGTLGIHAGQCTRTFVRMGGKYVLVDTATNNIYRLANPDRAQDFAAKRV